MYLIEVEIIVDDSFEREIIPFYIDDINEAIDSAKNRKKRNSNNEYRVYSTLNKLVFSTNENEVIL